MDMSRGMNSKGFREYYAEVKAQQMEEGFKKFPKAKVQDKAAMKPDTARGELQARRMDRARTAHTHKDTKDAAKAAVTKQELENRRTGMEKTYSKRDDVAVADRDKKKDGTTDGSQANTSLEKAYELERGRRRDIKTRTKLKSKGHSKDED